MRKTHAVPLVLVASALLATAVPTAASAVDGGTVSNNPAVVSVYSFTGDNLQTKTCTGVQVSPTVILTAQHCTTDGGGGTVVTWPTGANGAYGTDIAEVSGVTQAAEGDLSVLRLATPHPLASYPKVDAQYVPRAGDPITLFGAREGQQRTINGTVIEDHGLTIQVRTPGGGTRNGDSGGPLLVNGKVVGVLSTSNGLEDSWYAAVSAPSAAALIADQVPGTAVGNFGGVSTIPYYELRNVATGLALDLRDSSTAVGAHTAQQPFTGATSQQWTLVRDGGDVHILNRKSGLVVGVPGGSHTVGEDTIQWNAVGVRDQAWATAQQADGTFTFTNRESGQLLTAATTAAGGPIVQDNAHGTDAQKWTLVRVG